MLLQRALERMKFAHRNTSLDIRRNSVFPSRVKGRPCPSASTRNLREREFMRSALVKAIWPLFCLVTASGLAADTKPANPPPGPRRLIFPSSVPNKKHSEAMQAELRRLQEDDSFSKLKDWDRL